MLFFKGFWGFRPPRPCSPRPRYKRCQGTGCHPLSPPQRLDMAAKSSTLLLVLVAVGAAEAVAPLPCQGDPTSRCQDTATATRCGQERQCQDLWDSLALGDEANRDDTELGRGIKCSLCTKALKKIQALAGDNPDEAAVTAALKKGCRLLGRFLGKKCQRLVSQYQDQISQGLQDGDTPRDICTTMGICKA